VKSNRSSKSSTSAQAEPVADETTAEETPAVQAEDDTEAAEAVEATETDDESVDAAGDDAAIEPDAK
jgi:large subunit ribosomal protein L17